MGIAEKIWVILGLSIIFLILITDPKSSTSTISDSGKLNMMFSSITEGQKFLRKLTWLTITLFSLLTIGINL